MLFEFFFLENFSMFENNIIGVKATKVLHLNICMNIF
jgi:hypothetical protein